MQYASLNGCREVYVWQRLIPPSTSTRGLVVVGLACRLAPSTLMVVNEGDKFDGE
jgi:hypothetical protein